MLDLGIWMVFRVFRVFDIVRHVFESIVDLNRYPNKCTKSSISHKTGMLTHIKQHLTYFFVLSCLSRPHNNVLVTMKIKCLLVNNLGQSVFGYPGNIALLKNNANIIIVQDPDNSITF